MKKPLLYSNLLLLALVLLSFSLHQVNHEFGTKIPKEALNATQKMRFIEGGTFTMGYWDGIYYTRTQKDSMLLFSNESRRVTVSSFYISSQEVTNSEWMAFYTDKAKELGEAQAAAFYPDTLVWIKDFSYAYNDPMVQYYFKHIAYQDYPVVGVSWDMAQAYCNWYSNNVNKILEDAGMQTMPDFRLPSEAEWEYAALGVADKNPEVLARRIFPWDGNKLTDSKHQYLANFGTIRDANGFEHKSYDHDNNAYTSSVKSYNPNGFGLYNMAGNVSEWVYDVARPIYSSLVKNLNPFKSNQRELYQPDSAKNDSLKLAEEILQSCATGTNTLRLDTVEDRSFIDKVIKRTWQDIQVIKRSLGVEPRVVKGGSWNDPAIYLLCGSRQAVPQNKTSSMIGFRMGMTRVGRLDGVEPAGIQDLLIKRTVKKGR